MGPPMKLIDSDEEPEGDEFTINKSYADRYDIWRNKEELQKLKDLSKDISSSSSESEEEEPLIEKDFLKTLSLLKSKDPRIYDEHTEFFKDEVLPKKPKVKKEKPMFMKDYEREIILEQNGKFIDDEDDDDMEQLPKRKLLTNKEEQKLKKSFQEAAPSSDEEEDLWQVKTKTKVEEEKEEADYKQWLKTENDMGYLNNFWNNPDIGDDEKFLRDYILNKRYITDDKAGEIQTYDGITQDIDLLDEDEENLQKQEMFEHKYNFRFEEPDEEFIKSYPRTVGDSLRRENNKRKQKREEYTERKKKEKEQKKEELKRLKALKRKEIEERFLKLKEASGRDQLNLDESDMESDFDPDKHDQKMKEMFNDDYYNVEEEQKPEFEFDEEIDDENWDRWTRDQSKYSQSHSQGENYEESSSEEEDISKEDLRSQFEQEMIDSTTSNKKKKGKKKSLFAKILSQSKPLYDPSGKSFDEYLDEYYKLDYEDIVADMPVRFKYRKVVPNDFGLTVDEILAAQDKELNRWCSVKKTCQYRDDRDEMYDVQAFQKKAQNVDAKKKILTSVYALPEEERISQPNADNSSETSAKPKRKRKRSKKKKATENSDAVEGSVNSMQNDDLPTDNADPDMPAESTAKLGEDSKRKKKKKRKSLNNTSEENLKSYESANGPVEEHVQQNVSGEEVNHEDDETETNQNAVIKGKKKNKKKKSKSLGEGDSFLNNDSYIQAVDISIEKDRNKKKKRKKSQSVEENDSTAELQNDLQLSENVISEKRKRNLESLEKESTSSYDKAEAKHSQNVVKKRKMSVDETDLSLAQQPNNSPSKKSKSANNERTDYSLNDGVNSKSTAKSIYAENTVENGSNRKKKKKRKNNQQSFDSGPSRKQNFQSRKFHPNKKQNDNNSVQILDSSGKKIISSNSRLGAFEINPQKFKKRMIYGKNQT